jgi:hypothetical protein
MPGGMSMPYGGDSCQWNERQLDRGIELCKADLAAYHARQEQEQTPNSGCSRDGPVGGKKAKGVNLQSALALGRTDALAGG